jgi:hypothetical protein
MSNNEINAIKKSFQIGKTFNYLSSCSIYKAATCLVNCDFKLPALLA